MKDTIVEIGTILSHRTKKGMVEFKLNDEKTLWDIAKAREICGMLHQAIEAAISDTLIYQFLTEKIGLDEEKSVRALLDFREMRQGSKDTVFPFYVERLEAALRKVRDGMHYNPQTRTYSVSEADWFAAPYTSKSPSAAIDEELRAAYRREEES